jgi:hypothetical protein
VWPQIEETELHSAVPVVALRALVLAQAEVWSPYFASDGALAQAYSRSAGDLLQSARVPVAVRFAAGCLVVTVRR